MYRGSTIHNINGDVSTRYGINMVKLPYPKKGKEKLYSIIRSVYNTAVIPDMGQLAYLDLGDRP
jgi:hypothetical protein